MSYILSALKKAEQERYRGDVPDLMTPQPSDEVALPTRSSRRKAYFVTGGVAVVVVLGTIVVQRFDDSVDVANNALPIVSSFESPLRKPAAQVEPPPASDAFALSADGAPRFPVRDERVFDERDEAAHDFFAVAEPEDAPSSVDWGSTRSVDQVLDIDELPPSLRKHLPPLKLTGHLYSLAHPKARKVILNGIALKEKQYLGDELMISEIMPDGVILDFQGRLFRMGADHMFR